METRTLSDIERAELLSRIAETQDGGLRINGRRRGSCVLDTPSGWLRQAEQLNKNDYLSSLIIEAVREVDDPYEAYQRFQYAVDELQRAAFASSRYADELDQEVAK